jgi:hypothetical protein
LEGNCEAYLHLVTMLCIFSSNLWLQFCVLGYCAKILCFLLIACEIFKEKITIVILGKKMILVAL